MVSSLWISFLTYKIHRMKTAIMKTPLQKKIRSSMLLQSHGWLRLENHLATEIYSGNSEPRSVSASNFILPPWAAQTALFTAKVVIKKQQPKIHVGFWMCLKLIRNEMQGAGNSPGAQQNQNINLQLNYIIQGLPPPAPQLRKRFRKAGDMFSSICIWQKSPWNTFIQVKKE